MLTLIHYICRIKNMKEGIIMDNMPKEVISISSTGEFFEWEDRKRIFTYYLNRGMENETYIRFSSPYRSRPERSFEVIASSKDFTNGFKLVQTANKEYAYISEEDNTLLPYRYDIATDFNEYGFAMVGKNGKVSWIDKNFNYLNIEGKMEKEGNEFNGFTQVNKFSNGKIPLSKVEYKRVASLVSYFGIDGKIKEFYTFDGEKIIDTNPRKIFLQYSKDFTGDYALVNFNTDILLSSGYCLSNDTLIKICEENVSKYITNEQVKVKK